MNFIDKCFKSISEVQKKETAVTEDVNVEAPPGATLNLPSHLQICNTTDPVEAVLLPNDHELPYQSKFNNLTGLSTSIVG
jgi:hypothetical protein